MSKLDNTSAQPADNVRLELGLGLDGKTNTSFLDSLSPVAAAQAPARGPRRSVISIRCGVPVPVSPLRRGRGPGMLGADIIIGTLDTVTTGIMCYCPGAAARWRVD